MSRAKKHANNVKLAMSPHDQGRNLELLPLRPSHNKRTTTSADSTQNSAKNIGSTVAASGVSVSSPSRSSHPTKRPNASTPPRYGEERARCFALVEGRGSFKATPSRTPAPSTRVDRAPRNTCASSCCKYYSRERSIEEYSIIKSYTRQG